MKVSGGKTHFSPFRRISSPFIGLVHRWLNPLDLLDLLCSSSGYDSSLLIDLGKPTFVDMEEDTHIWPFIENIASICKMPIQRRSLLEAHCLQLESISKLYTCLSSLYHHLLSVDHTSEYQEDRLSFLQGLAIILAFIDSQTQ